LVLHEQHYFTASQKKHGMKGALREKVKNDAMNQMMNPNSMLEMMKGNMTFMVSNFVMMGLMSYFFGGFVLGACLNVRAACITASNAPALPFLRSQGAVLAHAKVQAHAAARH